MKSNRNLEKPALLDQQIEFDFDNDDELAPNSLRDSLEKHKLKEFEQEMQNPPD